MFRAVFLVFWLQLLASVCCAQGPTQATTVPLLLPGGLAYDTQGNLYFAETAAHLVRRVAPNGILTVVAGTGVQGFSGDGGIATAAVLDSPASVALDPSGNLFIADTHNHRIRRVDSGSGLITTVAGTGVSGASPNGTLAGSAKVGLPSALAFDAAGNLYFADAATHLIRRIVSATSVISTIAGNGIQGYSGDGGAATAAAIDSPAGLALDAAGNLYLADTHNHRVRRVDAVTGIITTVSGTGQPGFSGDQGLSSAARIDLPRGLAIDSAGDLFIVDSLNQRLRRIDAVSGQITTVAGDGVQAYAGDGGLATAAAINLPRAVAISPANLATVGDSGNARVRQIDSAAKIHAIAGLGATASTTLTLAANSVILYGTGAATATLASSPATGSITFLDAAGSASEPSTIGTVAVSGNAASQATTGLAAGPHHLTATYSGDTNHLSAESGTIAVSIVAAPVTAMATPVSIPYGSAIPALTGSLTGVLAQDASSVTAVFATGATSVSPVGTYPIAASLTGPAAGNYSLTAVPSVVTINKAAAAVTLLPSLAAHVASTTSGVPTGGVQLRDGSTSIATAVLNASGDAVFSSVGLSAGSHTLTAVYGGDGNFLAATSAPLSDTIGTASLPDFTLAATSSTSVTLPSGNAATFGFAITPVNGALSSPILLTASGLPVGATASFNPAYLPPSGNPETFVLTIQTTKIAQIAALRLPFVLALLLPLAWLRRRRVILLGLALFTIGCGTRIHETSAAVASARTYNITVLATATTATGATLQHTLPVTLTLQ